MPYGRCDESWFCFLIGYYVCLFCAGGRGEGGFCPGGGLLSGGASVRGAYVRSPILTHSAFCSGLSRSANQSINQYSFNKSCQTQNKLEGCIDDDRPFKTAKRLVTPLF